MKFYCHYDSSTLNILQIGCHATPHECDLAGVQTFEIPEEIGKGILSGELQVTDFHVHVKRHTASLIKKSSIKVETIRPELITHVQLRRLKKPDASIRIVDGTVIYSPLNLPPLIEHNARVAETCPQTFYVTSKNDMTIYLGSFSIEDFTVPQTFEVRKEINSEDKTTSIFTVSSKLKLSYF